MTELIMAAERLIKRHGSLRGAARAISVSPAYLCRLRKGERLYPSLNIQRKMGIKEVRLFERMR